MTKHATKSPKRTKKRSSSSTGAKKKRKVHSSFAPFAYASKQTWADLKAGKIKGLKYEQGKGLRFFMSKPAYKAAWRANAESYKSKH